MGCEPEARGAVVGRELDLEPRQQPAMPLQRRHAGGLEQREDSLGALLDDTRLALLHGGDVELHLAELDAVGLELVLGAMHQLGGLQQRLGGNAAGVQAGAAEAVAAVVVLPFVDAGHGQLVLGRANSRGIARRATADHHHVEVV